MAFSVSFVFKATDKYTTTLTKMAKANRKLYDSMKRLNAVVKSSGVSLTALGKKLDSAGTKFTSSSGKVVAFTRNMRSATKATTNQITAINRLNRVNVKRINFGGNAGGGGGPRGRGGRSKGLGDAFGDAAMNFGAIGGALIAPAVYSAKKAMDYEKQFASVKKVIGDTIDDPAVMKSLYQNLVQMSGRMPVDQSEIFKIAQVAGSAGIGDYTRQTKGLQAARQEIQGFVELMGQTSVAFDMGGEEVTNFSMALVRQFDFKDPVKEMRVLNDQINQLENKMGSDAYGILNNMRRIGGITSMLGLDAKSTAAFSSMLLDVGVPERMVDTSLKDFMKTFIDPKGLPDKQYAALAGIWSGGKKFKNAKEIEGVVGDFHTKARANPLQTMLELIKKIKDRGPEALTAVSRIFGPEYASMIGLMVKRVDRMQYALNLVGDKAAYSGSMLREMAAKTNTLSGQLGIFKNIINGIAAAIGEGMDEQLRETMKSLNLMLIPVLKWIQENPKMVAGIVMVSAALGTLFLVAGAVAGAFAFFAPLITLIMTFGTVLGGTAILMASLGAIATAVGGFIAAWFWPITAVIAALALLGKVVWDLYTKWQPFKNFVDSYVNALKECALVIGSTLNFALQGTIKLLGDLYNKMVDIAGVIANTPLGQWVGGMLNDQAAKWQTQAMQFKRYRETGQWGDATNALSYAPQAPVFPHTAPKTPSPFGNMNLTMDITMQDNRTNFTTTMPDGSKKTSSVANTGKNMIRKPA